MRPHYFCGCCTLKTGCYIIATYNIIECLAFIGVFAWVAVSSGAMWYHIGTGLSSIGFLGSLIGLYGVHKEILFFIGIWYQLNIEIITANLFITTGAVVIVIISPSPFIITLAVICSVSSLLEIYYIIVIILYFNEIEDNPRSPSDVEAAGNVYTISNGNMTQPRQSVADTVDTIAISETSPERVATNSPPLNPSTNIGNIYISRVLL